MNFPIKDFFSKYGNVNRITIYRAKTCFGLVALKVLPASFFRYNSWKKYKIPDFENESKQN